MVPYLVNTVFARTYLIFLPRKWHNAQRAQYISLNVYHCITETINLGFRGFKTFTLCPPHSVLRIPHRLCKNFVHRRSDHDVGRLSGTCSETATSRNTTDSGVPASQKRRWTVEEAEGETLWVDGRPGEWPGVQCLKVVVKMGKSVSFSRVYL